MFGKLQREHRYTNVYHAVGNHSDEGRNSKVGEYAANECALSNAFNGIVKKNRSSKRVTEGISTNPPE
jgi:hypothetical protein